MARDSSEIQDVSPTDGSTGSETAVRSLLYDYTSTGDSELRSMVEENAFQALSEGSLIKRPRYTFCVSKPDEDNDFLSLTFPRKLWKIIESDQFKSIWWDENGTSIIINEELFKKEVLERKTPFRIFETESMKSLVRQLNLYGFSKIRKNFQRSACLANFLVEEKEVSALSKLQFYHNPNFKRGCPQLLVRMKRRVGIRNSSPLSSSLVQDFNKKHTREGGHVDNQNAAETRGQNLSSTSTDLSASLITKPSTSQISADTAPPIRSGFSPPSLISSRPSHQMVTNHNAILNRLTTFHMHSHSSYIQANDHIVNFVTTTTSTSRYHIISPVQNTYFGLIMVPSTFPAGHPDLLTSGAPFPNLLGASNTWFPVPMIADTSASTLSRANHQPSSLYQHHPNYE